MPEPRGRLFALANLPSLPNLLAQAAQRLPLGVVDQETLQQRQGGGLLAAVGEAAHLQHAGATAGLAATLLEDLGRGAAGIGLGDADRLSPGVEGGGDIAGGHGLASGHIEEPGIAEGLSRRIGQPAAAGLQFAAGQGQVGGADAGQGPVGADGGQQLPKAVAGRRFGGDLGVAHQPHQGILQGRLQGGGPGQGAGPAQDQQRIQQGRLEGGAPVGLELGQQLPPEGLTIGLAPTAQTLGQGQQGWIGWGRGLRRRPEAPGVGPQGEVGGELVGF